MSRMLTLGTVYRHFRLDIDIPSPLRLVRLRVGNLEPLSIEGIDEPVSQF
jgi:hypothetical protein